MIVRLTKSESGQKHPATVGWLYLAIMRLAMRPGPQQLDLLRKVEVKQV